MRDKKQHITNLEEKSSEFFSKGNIAWEKSEAEVWAELENSIQRKPAAKLVAFNTKILRWSAAAVVAIVVGLSALTFLYSKTVESLPGEQLVAELPDGSRVELNAGSTLKYYPLKWKFERKLKFSGEAYFEVQKGEKFEVESENGSTRVLGTSFNIYSRDTQYRVTCLTGKVEVVSKSKESVFLTPNNHVEIENGKFVMKTENKAENYVRWKNNEFFFAGRPLKEVFEEVERQYGVTIQLDPDLYKRNFASNFSKKHKVEDVLDFVCKSMQIQFVKQSENVFLIVEKS
jgi:transmembrane sensor